MSTLLQLIRQNSYDGIQRFPRLLELMEKFPKTRELFAKETSTIPSWKFIDWIDSMLGMVNTFCFDAVQELLKRIGNEYPQAFVYPFNLAFDSQSSSQSSSRSDSRSSSDSKPDSKSSSHSKPDSHSKLDSKSSSDFKPDSKFQERKVKEFFEEMRRNLDGIPLVKQLIGALKFLNNPAARLGDFYDEINLAKIESCKTLKKNDRISEIFENLLEEIFPLAPKSNRSSSSELFQEENEVEIEDFEEKMPEPGEYHLKFSSIFRQKFLNRCGKNGEEFVKNFQVKKFAIFVEFFD